MAKGKTKNVTVVLNNMSNTTTTKDVELVVVGEQLLPEKKDIEPGVNTLLLKN